MRNVTIVVAVLMISCQVSTLWITKYDGAHTRTSSTHRAKNQGLEKNPAATFAKRSNTETSGVTSEGMCGVGPAFLSADLILAVVVAVMGELYPANTQTKRSTLPHDGRS